MGRIKKFNKRKFYGNVHTRKVTDNNITTNENVQERPEETTTPRPRPVPIPSKPTTPSSSSKKLKYVSMCGDKKDYIQDKMIEGNVLIDISILQNDLLKVVKCKECSAENSLEIFEIPAKRKGIVCSLELICKFCNFKISFMTSPKTKSEYYEHNLRLVYAFRSIGKGEKAAAVFTTVMNMPQPPAKFHRYNKTILDGVNKVATDSMTNATREAVIHNDGNSDIGAMFDGTWQKRGYSSLNGVFTASSIDTGKILDVQCLTKYCFVCKGKNVMGHDNCQANYKGSSGAMEVDGAKLLFSRSSNRAIPVRYVNYLGDGDSKAFQSVVDSKPYGPDVNITKLECIGHVQKRMGTRLRNLKKTHKGKLCSDGKKLSGKGRLTKYIIDQLQTYYGNAIRANVNNLSDMENAVWATFYHKLSTDDEPYHGLCPKGSDSWCKQNRAEALKLPVPPHENSIPKAVMEVIKPIYKDLCDKSLLKKCLHGKTQNQTESFNNVIWTRIPKNVFVREDTLRLGVLDALICFNEGSLAKVQVLEHLCGKAGSNAVVGLKKQDELRLRDAERAMKEIEKRARQKRRSSKRILEDDEEADEPSYATGAF